MCIISGLMFFVVGAASGMFLLAVSIIFLFKD